jgi:hypothetical protein
MKKNPPYLKRDKFYLIEVRDSNTEVNRKIASYLGKDYIPYYLGPNDTKTRNPCDAQIIKHRDAVFRKMMYLKSLFVVKEVMFNRSEFLSMMELNHYTNSYTSARNKKLYKKEKIYTSELQNYRTENNFGTEYTPPENLDAWTPCPVCERKPLINKQEDVTYISCGCHKDGGLLTIPCKNNLEPVTPLFTWNHWVKNSTLLFSDI